LAFWRGSSRGGALLYMVVSYWEYLLPRRNYGFEKRQKELNKQRKREEKEQRKLERAKGLVEEALPERSEDTGSAPEV